MDDLYVQQTLDKMVYISANDLNSNIDKNISQKLNSDLNGICIKEGFVKPNSIDIILRSEGNMKVSNFKAVVYYNVKYNVMICNPIEGQLIECMVSEVNKSNITCYVESEETSPLNIFLSKQHHLGNEEYAKIKSGDKIKIRVLAKKFQYRDKQILVIGQFLEIL
jgi:DNA-directed RNA polymerase subunit E'/Rpb7